MNVGKIAAVKPCTREKMGKLVDAIKQWFTDSDVVGITAGASTPDNIIEDVTAKIKSFSNNLEEELIYE